jgi:hypothetical protein
MSRNEEMTGGEQGGERRHDLERKLGAAAWGLFFVWIGIVFVLSIQGSIAMLVVGVIMLGAQFIRRSLGLQVERFWIFLGVVFVAGGLWGFSQVNLPLFPILLIVAGAALLLSIFRGRCHSA